MVHRFMSPTVAAALLTIAATSAFAADAGAISQESPSQWRASKLAGVSIYGPQNKSVGKVTDVLMSKDGKAEFIIIGVGGFLGIGEKDVAVPYDQVKFTDQPMMPPANPAGFDNTMGGTAANGGVVPATTSSGAGGVPTAAALGVGPVADTPSSTPAAAMTVGLGSSSNMAPRMAQSTAYPDHGTIDMTADQLKSAPAFKFAS